MGIRTVTGDIHQGDGAPWSEEIIRFVMDAGSFTTDITYPRSRVEALTDQDGAFSVELVSGLANTWTCYLPDGTSFGFTLPDGDPISIETLRATYYVPPPSPETMQAYLDRYHPDYSDTPEFTVKATGERLTYRVIGPGRTYPVIASQIPYSFFYGDILMYNFSINEQAYISATYASYMQQDAANQRIQLALYDYDKGTHRPTTRRFSYTQSSAMSTSPTSGKILTWLTNPPSRISVPPGDYSIIMWSPTAPTDWSTWANMQYLSTIGVSEGTDLRGVGNGSSATPEGRAGDFAQYVYWEWPTTPGAFPPATWPADGDGETGPGHTPGGSAPAIAFAIYPTP